MISPTITLLLPLTVNAAALCRPRTVTNTTLEVQHPDNFMTPTATIDNVVSHSAGFLAPATRSEEIVHRPDDLMAPTPSMPTVQRPDDFMGAPTTQIPSSTAGILTSSPGSGWLHFSFPSPTTIGTTTPAPSPTQPFLGFNPSLISWASWITASTPAPTFTYAPSDISFASWANPSTLSTSPSPSSSPTPHPSDSTPGAFLLCVDTFFRGECTSIHSATFQCHNLPAAFQRRATSIRPHRNQTCLFFDAEDCHGRADWMRWPGSANMRGRRFDERVVSWRCAEDGCEGVRGPGGCGEGKEGTLKM